jgi:hypothetical protein
MKAMFLDFSVEKKEDLLVGSANSITFDAGDILTAELSLLVSVHPEL